jgi:hypothetical protein
MQRIGHPPKPIEIIREFGFLDSYAQSSVQPEEPRKDGEPEWLEVPIWLAWLLRLLCGKRKGPPA